MLLNVLTECLLRFGLRHALNVPRGRWLAQARLKVAEGVIQDKLDWPVILLSVNAHIDVMSDASAPHGRHLGNLNTSIIKPPHQLEGP